MPLMLLQVAVLQAGARAERLLKAIKPHPLVFTPVTDGKVGWDAGMHRAHQRPLRSSCPLLWSDWRGSIPVHTARSHGLIRQSATPMMHSFKRALDS